MFDTCYMHILAINQSIVIKVIRMSVIIVLKDDLIKRKAVQPQHCQRQLDDLRNKATPQPYPGVRVFLLISAAMQTPVGLTEQKYIIGLVYLNV